MFCFKLLNRPICKFSIYACVVMLVGCKSSFVSPDTSNQTTNKMMSQVVEAPQFTKIIIDTIFRSESITSADVNNDGLPDIIIGDVWFAAPDWHLNEIRPQHNYSNKVHVWGTDRKNLAYYSNSFAVQSMDVNDDGWSDVIIFPVMNQPVYWYENPRGKKIHWQERIAYHSYHGESPLRMKLADDSKSYPLAGFITSDSLLQLGVIVPNENIDDKWNLKTIGSTSVKKYRGPGWDKLSKYFAPGARDHGLGIGDINGDKGIDVLTRSGWYESPKDGYTPDWKFHPVPFDTMASLEAPHLQFAQMEIFDIDQDGDADFFGSSAHQYGLWWFEQTYEDGKVNFVKHDIPIKLSQAHAVARGDLNDNGIQDIITGKRYLAHTGNDPGWNDPIELIWLEPYVTKDGKVEWKTVVIDTGVGVGTQIELVDINIDGKVDILTSNKKGTHVFIQK